MRISSRVRRRIVPVLELDVDELGHGRSRRGSRAPSARSRDSCCTRVANEGGLSVVYLFFKPNFPLFRHQHEVDSLYVVISGSVVDLMGTETLRPGDCFSVPARTPYYYTAGPEGVEVHEIFRDADTVTVVYVDNPAGRVEQAQEAVRANAETWREITSGPLFRTREQ